jgi:hypothetical protein
MDPRDRKEWRVSFTWTIWGPEPSDPVARFYHHTEPGTTGEMLSADRRGDEKLGTMIDQALMDLLDEATP